MLDPPAPRNSFVEQQLQLGDSRRHKVELQESLLVLDGRRVITHRRADGKVFLSSLGL